MGFPSLRLDRGAAAFALWILALALPVRALAFSPEHLNQVTFVNQTGYEIVYLFFSPSDSEYWGVDILGSERTLDAGQKLTYLVYYPDECNSFDFLAIDEDGDAYTIWDVELCDGTSRVLTVSLSDLAGPFGELDFASVELRNALMHRIDYLFVSPADSNSWGVDILDARTTLSPNQTVEILVLRSALREEYDLLAVDSDLDRYRFGFLIDAPRHYVYEIEYSDMYHPEEEITAALGR
ncbi:MAG: hypothetical protein EA403_16330 [Spirochaetaceae bacterium]|nr:MAG: hypothetical protein EA403_16330 [Spirochaetaceae bacterium]